MARDIQITIRNVKSTFFDRAVAQKLDPAIRKAYSKFGAYVRADARQSMRRKSRRFGTGSQGRDARGRFTGVERPNIWYAPSRPGHPPGVITGHIKRYLYFGLDRQANSVVIGPTLLPGKKRNFGRTAVDVLEHAGWAEKQLRFTNQRRRFYIKKRPYMQPAFDKNFAKLGPALKDIA